MMVNVFVTFFILYCVHVSCETLTNFTFPDGFLFGTSTAAYQIEGAWNKDGKGESIWDHFCHTYPERVRDHSNGDDAAKSYYKYMEDIQAVKDMGMDFYRFSIAWTRIMPNGLPDSINQKGIDYYNNVINALVKNGIKPLVTMYHWDLPQNLQELGGWTNRIIVDLYEIYARILFENFGDRVKHWLTFNEPEFICMGYEVPVLAPGKYTYGVGPYLAGHNILLSHARVYHMYDKEFRSTQNGNISMSPTSMTVIPLDPNSESDKEAAELFMESFVGWFAHPIYSEKGDYPQSMKDNVAKHSKEQGYSKSRLPEFTPEEVQYIKGTGDFFAVNDYSINLINKSNEVRKPSVFGDLGVNIYTSKSWYASKETPWDAIAPLTLRKLLNWIRDRYGAKWPILITENGYPDGGGTNDTTRILYLGTYMTEILKTIYIDHVNVIGYTVWSVIDNFEWTAGYSVKFGLYDVNYNDPERARTPKKSSYFMRNITSTRTVPKQFLRLDNQLDEIILSPKLRRNLVPYMDLL